MQSMVILGIVLRCRIQEKKSGEPQNFRRLHEQSNFTNPVQLGVPYCTRNSLTFVSTTDIEYTKILSLRPGFCAYARLVVFTNVRELRV